MERLTNDNIKEVAFELGIEPCALMAVKNACFGKNPGFYDDNKPVIRFEGHIFWNELKRVGIDPGKIASKHPTILYSKWTKNFYQPGGKEYTRLEEAMTIHKEAAQKSTLWGFTELLGKDYKMYGCSTFEEFLEKVKESELTQLKLFGRYLQNRHWVHHLQSLNWKEFARQFCGPGYAQTQFDKRLEILYNEYKRNMI